MRVFRLLFAAIVGLFALLAAGFVAVAVLIGGVIGLILSRLGLARGHVKVNVQRGPTSRAGAHSRQSGTRVHAPDAIDIEATPVDEAASVRHSLPSDRTPQS